MRNANSRCQFRRSLPDAKDNFLFSFDKLLNGFHAEKGFRAVGFWGRNESLPYSRTATLSFLNGKLPSFLYGTCGYSGIPAFAGMTELDGRAYVDFSPTTRPTPLSRIPQSMQPLGCCPGEGDGYGFSSGSGQGMRRCLAEDFGSVVVGYDEACVFWEDVVI